jgi:two-component system LytT family response regulator
MTRIRTLVVDDEPVARERIIGLLAAHEDIEVVGQSSNGTEAVAAIERLSPDLVFLDVQMPELNGFGVVRALQTASIPAVVFVTAYDEYAIRAFEVHAVDYLLKPFSGARFNAALEHVREHLERHRASDLGRKLLALAPTLATGSTFSERLLVRASGRIHFVRTTELDWCEAAGNYVRLHVGGQSHLLRETMTTLEAALNPQQFVRIHRSTIVNVERIQELQSTANGECTVFLQSGARLTMSRGYREAFQERFGKSL